MEFKTAVRQALVEFRYACIQEYQRTHETREYINPQAFELPLYKIGLLDYSLALEFRMELHGKRLRGGQVLNLFDQVWTAYWHRYSPDRQLEI